MNYDNEHYQLLQEAAQKSFQLLTELHQKPLQFSDLLNKYMELTEDIFELVTVLLLHPQQLMKMQTDYWADVLKLMHQQCNAWMEGKPLPIEDKRFTDKYWLENPYFNLLSQNYLLITKHMQTMMEGIDLEDKGMSRRLQFFIRQYLDAISPSNFIATNPKLLAETFNTQGKNVLKGLNNLLSDLESSTGDLNITMTDKKAFTIGKNLATTPGKVIFRNDMMELIQYTPQTETVYSRPLLMIPPWINKYYILDLSPENSLVGWFVKQGITVFIISWVNPDESYANKTLFNYMDEGPLTAIKVIKEQLNVKQINTLGFCIGGTLLGMLLAYNQYHKDTSVNSAIFLATLLDFQDPGDIAVFIDEQQIVELEESMKTKGYLAGKFMASSFNALRANDLFWTFFIKNYLQGKEAAPFDILYWNGDTTNMPATMHSQYLRWMYLHNHLMEPGKIKLNNAPIDIHKINIPTFFLGTQKDHIAPWKSTWSGFHTVKGKKQFVLGGSGHIAGIVNPVGSGKYGYYTNNAESTSAEEWLLHATWHVGSWWPEAMKWLSKQSGKKVPAPEMAKLPYPGIMDAPGSYVLKLGDQEIDKKK